MRVAHTSCWPALIAFTHKYTACVFITFLTDDTLARGIVRQLCHLQNVAFTDRKDPSITLIFFHIQLADVLSF